MSTPLIFGILLEVVIFGVVIILFKKLKRNKSNQPSLSNKTIKNLKF